MSTLSDIYDLEQEVAECEAALSDIENEESIISRLKQEISDEAETPINDYDMTVSDEFRGHNEDEAEMLRASLRNEIASSQAHTSKLLSEIAIAKERIRAHIRELKSRIEELKALLEPQSNDNAE